MTQWPKRPTPPFINARGRSQPRDNCCVTRVNKPAYNSPTACSKTERAVFVCLSVAQVAPQFAFHDGKPTVCPHSHATVTEIILAGLAMMLVFEGLLPLLSPRAWRETMQRILAFKDGQLRFVGLSSVVAGLLMLAWAVR
jgi:uncharacterized protein YjeT (DUF2065 family)